MEYVQSTLRNSLLGNLIFLITNRKSVNYLRIKKNRRFLVFLMTSTL